MVLRDALDINQFSTIGFFHPVMNAKEYDLLQAVAHLFTNVSSYILIMSLIFLVIASFCPTDNQLTTDNIFFMI